MQTRKSVKTVLSFLLAALLVLPLSAPLWAGAESGAARYVITNPYEAVDFGTWHAYKTQLHVHTNASDGDTPVITVVEEHYRLDFDILAITDHATLNRGWNVETPTVPLFRLVKYERTQMAPMIPMPQARYDEITNGAGREGRPMLDVPLGNELNGAVFSNSHVNGFFVEYGHGLLGVEKDYETPVKAVHGLGGYSMINHPGDTTGSYANPAVNNDTKTIDKYAGLFLKYWPSCFALDINSISDGTRTDEVLYDNVLEKLIPYGITPWLVAFSDAHQMGQWNRGFTMHMMQETLEAANKENALEDLKRSLRDGTYFGIYTISPGGVYLPDTAVPPMVKDILVEGNVITIVPEDAELVTEVVWVTNGTKEINKGSYTIDVAEFSGDIGSFVRAYLRGPGGICYTQPFTVVPEGAELEKEEIGEVFDISVVLRCFVTVAGKFFKYNPLMWAFKRIALGIR